MLSSRSRTFTTTRRPPSGNTPCTPPMLVSRNRYLLGIVLALTSWACRPTAGTVVSSGNARKGTAKESKYPARVHAKRAPAALARPEKPLSLAEAQRYFLKLVNRDREAEGLEPVAWDPVAERAGREHAADMAEHGFTSHHGTDGSVPELRYSRAGGDGMVQENAACFFDEKERRVDKNALFSAEAIEKAEASFLGEKPPNDGHRRNILTPWHNRVGIGLAQPVGVPIPCVAQEFVDHYGSYDPLGGSARVGDKVHVAGSISPPAVFGGVGVARIDAPTPRTPVALNATHSYPVPEPYATFFPRGYVTPVPVQVDDNRFSIDVPLDDGRRAGVYEISVWATVPETADLVMVSLRTISVK
jgi:uncharacterized protein YkwD